MIEGKKFEHIKKDFIFTYKQLLCGESINDIEGAKDWKSFVEVLRKYMVFNNYRPFPDVEWARKWFKNEKRSLNEENIYLDQVVSLADPTTPVFLFGDCVCSVVVSKPKTYRVLAQDTSKLNVFMFAKSVVFVKIKDRAEVIERVNRNKAILKVRHYETRVNEACNEPQWK